MKNIQNKTLIILGSLCGVIPIYSGVSWFRHFYLWPNLEQSELVEKFRQDFLFGYSWELYKLSLITILIGAISIACFGVLLERTGSVKDKREAIRSKAIRLSLLIIVSVFTFLNIWSLW